jgi:hypothetical protein
LVRLMPLSLTVSASSESWHLDERLPTLNHPLVVFAQAPVAPSLAGQAGEADEIDWSRASLDSSERGGQKGGEKVGKNPTDRGKPGSKRHLVCDRKGVLLAVVLSAANVHDSKVFEDVVDAIEPIRRPAVCRGLPHSCTNSG